MSSVQIRTTAGVVEGRSDGSVVAFLGVPYAAPTGGEDRFKPPRPVEEWPGVRPATTWGPRSYQTAAPNPFHELFPQTFAAIVGDDLTLDVPMSEDCLSVNVWAPASESSRPRPVLFWLHGGGACGSPSEYRADGSVIALRGDVVVVSVTHRLNVFGYLYLPHIAGDEYRTSGGVGHLDLVAALEWVRDNIARFGGDPHDVTLFGESAGGAKVACLMAMPQARRLFRRAVIQSGAETSTGLGATIEEATAFTAAFLAELNLGTQNWAELLRLPAEELVRTHEVVSQRLGVPYVLPPPGPTIDGVVLPLSPIQAAVAGECADVPLIIGACRDETKLFLLKEDSFAGQGGAGTSPKPDRAKELDGPLAMVGREAFEEWLGPGAAEIIDAYRRSRPDASFPEIESAVRGDRQFLVPSLRFAEALLETGRAPVYVYSFAWESDVVPGLGAFHSMDIQFFFSTTERMPITNLDPTSRPLAERMTDALIAFARTGDPNHPGLPQWAPYDPARRATMIFDRACEVADDPRSEERRAWQSVPTDRLGF